LVVGGLGWGWGKREGKNGELRRRFSRKLGSYEIRGRISHYRRFDPGVTLEGEERREKTCISPYTKWRRVD